MKRYINELHWKIEKYRARYGDKELKVALRLGIWNLRYVLKHFFRLKKSPKGKELHIGFEISGGLGDFLIAFNYIHKFKEHFKNLPLSIEVLCSAKQIKMAQHFYSDEIHDITKIKYADKYDLFISLNRFPKIEEIKKERLSQISPKLFSLTESYQKFAKTRTAIFSLAPYGDGLAAHESVCEGKIRLQQPDIDGILAIGTDFSLPIPYPSEEQAILNKWNIPKKFITVNRGVDAANAFSDNTKMWPLEYYNKLIPLLKKHFPGVTIVQLGVSTDRSPLMDGVDISLVGKTTLDDLKVLLKNAFLHIDGEGGMIHLRHALHGDPSVVLFGPTSYKFYGYPKNMNLHSSICDWCEWVHDNWNGKCLKSGGSAECMKTLTPEIVIKAIQEKYPQ